MHDFADRLLREQIPVMRERRGLERKPFVRPVTVLAGPHGEERIASFSRDLSPVGIGVISDVTWQVGQIATLEIHSLMGRPVRVRCEVRWCEPYGEGWHLSGWHFLVQLN